MQAFFVVPIAGDGLAWWQQARTRHYLGLSGSVPGLNDAVQPVPRRQVAFRPTSSSTVAVAPASLPGLRWVWNMRLTWAASCALIAAIGCSVRSTGPQTHEERASTGASSQAASNPGRAESRKATPEDLVSRLRAEVDVVRYSWARPGGWAADLTPAMEACIEGGTDLEPLLIRELEDVTVRDKAAAVLSHVGGPTAVAALVRALPGDSDEHWSRAVKIALRQLTGQGTQIDFGAPPTTQAWRTWHARNAPYLYVIAGRPWDDSRLDVDLEAKVAGAPSEEFRRTHPRRFTRDFARWKDSPASAAELREFCVSRLLADVQQGDTIRREGLLSLARIDDPRTRRALSLLALETEFSATMPSDWAWADSLRTGVDPLKSPPAERSQSVTDLRAALRGAEILPSARAAAELYRRGLEEGLARMLQILDLRPLDHDTARAIRETCEVLGEMRERAGIEPLSRLLAENLNVGWTGCPHATALARMGEDDGIRFLARTIEDGDPHEVVGSWPYHSDIESTGRRTFIPMLIPILDSRHVTRRIHAARTIVRLLDSGDR